MATIHEKAHLVAKKQPALPVTDDREDGNRLILVVMFLLIFLMAARTPLDSDMWWHLRVGEEILSGKWLSHDIFSFTRAGAPWTNPFWLFQIGMALCFRLGGFLALSALVALLATFSMWLVERQCEGPAALKAAALLLGSVVASTCWPPRPLISSLVWMALVGVILNQYKRNGRDLLWTLPFVFILWSNTHGGYPLGLIFIGSHIAGEVLNQALGGSEHSLSWRQIGKLAVVAVLCGFAVLVNPNGLQIWWLPFQTVNMQSLQQFIPEWASPDFHQPIEQSFMWLLLSVFAVVALSGRRMDGSDLVSLILFTVMAMLARRNFAPFALVAVPILTRYAAASRGSRMEKAPWQTRLEVFNRRFDRKPAAPPGLRKVVNLFIVGLLGFVTFGKLYGVSHPALVGNYLQQGYPVQAVTWLEANEPPGRLFNEYDWGGYLQWQLDGFPVFVDGRTDLYGDAIIGKWRAVMQGQTGWQTILDENDVDYILLRTEQGLLEKLPAAGWKLLYQDGVATIYARP